MATTDEPGDRLARRDDATPDRISADTREDTSWVGAFGGVVTRQSPPVGSIAVGIPGVGFDLVTPDGMIAESYGPDGALLGPSRLEGAQVPAIASEAAGEAPKGTDEYSEIRCPDRHPPKEHDWVSAYDPDDALRQTCLACPAERRFPL